MADPIEVNYTPDGDDWTVSVKGRGQTLSGRAPGLIAARDRADQLVEKIAPEEQGHKTVVHMLEGDAVEFTNAYLTARLAKSEPVTDAGQEPAADAEQPDAEQAAESASESTSAAESTEEQAEDKETPRPSPKPRPTPPPRQEAETGQAGTEQDQPADEPAKSTS